MKDIRFVDVGEGITEGKIQKWLVKDGDSVKEDQSVAMVETDKATVNVPAPITGAIKIVLPEGTILHIGDTLCYIGTADELRSAGKGMPAAQPAAKPAAQTQALVQQKAAPPATKPAPKETLATPYVRKLAHDLDVDISKVAGTGPGGRVLDSDVKAAAGGTASRTAPPPMYPEHMEQQHAEETERVQMSQTRKAIARNMEESWKIPRASHMDLIDATALYDMVAKEKPKIQKEKNIHLTFLPFVIKAVIQALKENPRFNASYDHDKQEVILKKYYNIGLAAEAPDGLKVVVVKGADKKSPLEIAKEIQDFHDKVLNMTITIAEMRDSTFTITNIGSLGGGFLAVPMINPGEAAILGITAIRDWPFADGGKVRIGKVLPFVITFDHRLVDGADAVKFGNAVKNYLEDPDFLEVLG